MYMYIDLVCVCIRYEGTIAEQFFGHTHAMYYEMFYDDVTFLRPLGVAYMPGSITTYSDLNPGFRIYELDGNYQGTSWVCFVVVVVVDVHHDIVVAHSDMFALWADVHNTEGLKAYYYDIEKKTGDL